MKAKHSYLIALLTLLVAACGGKKETSFDKLIAQRDSLMSEQTELNKKLEEVDDKIAKLDTTRKKLKVTAFESFALGRNFQSYYSNDREPPLILLSISIIIHFQIYYICF